jgi:hypothetical protein
MTRIPPGFLTGWLTCSLLLFALPSQRAAAQDRFEGILELTFTSTDSSFENALGERTESRSTFLLQRFRFTIGQELLPRLTLRAGGFFERDTPLEDSFSGTTDFQRRRWNPFLGLYLGGTFHTAELRYDRNHESTDFAGAGSIGLVRESYTAGLTWRPAGLPSLSALFVRNVAFDEPRSAIDTARNSLSLSTAYEGIRDLRLRYRFNYDDQADKVLDAQFQSRMHSLNLSYSRRLFDQRLLASASYSLRRQDLQSLGTGRGEIPRPVQPVAGLFAVDETPAEGELPANAALIDGDLTTSARVDLGRAPSLEGDTRYRNLGVDFFSEPEINGFHIWVDREVPATVARLMTWDVYTSRDNRTWTLQESISGASFGPLDSRLEIRFRRIASRYVKVVTRPLPLAIPIPPGVDLTHLLVTELEPFLAVALDVAHETSSMVQLGNLDLRTRILNSPHVVHNLSYWFSLKDDEDVRDVLSNGVFATYPFSERISGSSMIVLENGRTAGGSRLALRYNASVLAQLVPALSSRVMLSGLTERIGGQTARADNTLTLESSAALFDGVDMTLSGSLGSIETAGRHGFRSSVQTAASLVPHRSLTLSVSFVAFSIRGTGGEDALRSSSSRVGSARLTFQPFGRVYLFGSTDVVADSDSPTRTLQNYGLSWSPWAEGQLQVSFAYNESLSSLDESRERYFLPSLRWAIRPRTHLEVTYSLVRSDSLLFENDSNSLNARLMIGL